LPSTFQSALVGVPLEPRPEALPTPDAPPYQTNAMPSSVNLGGNYEPRVVLEVLDHLALCWSAQPPERKAPRHRVKSRVTITYGFDGVLAALDPGGEVLFDPEKIESWIVENVSAGGFGALVPQLRGDWLKIGRLLGLQPEGGSNWLIGVVRRFQRDASQQGAVGIQTLGRAAQTARVRLVSGQIGPSLDTESIPRPKRSSCCAARFSFRVRTCSWSGTGRPICSCRRERWNAVTTTISCAAAP